jgi:hypothetical protein
MPPASIDPKQRTLEALEIISETYGVGQDLDALQAAGNWQPSALAMLAEAVAAILIEQRARKPVRAPRLSVKLSRAQAQRVV